METIGVWGTASSRGSGIGKQITASLLEQKKEVHVFGRSITKLEEMKKEFPSIKGIFQWDPIEASTLKLYQNYLIENHITSIVCTIGLGYSNPIPFLSLREMRDMIESNLIAEFHIMKTSIVPMKHLGGGRMIFFGSIVSFRPQEGASGYTASKMGLRGLLESSRYELKTAFKEISIHGLYSQNINRIQMKTIVDSVLYLLQLPKGIHADLIVDA